MIAIAVLFVRLLYDCFKWGRLGCLAMLPYITRLHLLAGKFIACHFDYSFGQLPFVHRNPLANQLDGFFLISLIHKKIPHAPRFPLEIEGRDANLPTCCHSGDYAPQSSQVKRLP